jgi:hypothetical protein
MEECRGSEVRDKRCRLDVRSLSPPARQRHDGYLPSAVAIDQSENVAWEAEGSCSEIGVTVP